jgi:L-malate glycosyltransferase
MSTTNTLPRVALVWSQFASHHVDRCEALAARLEGRAEVLAVEVATTSREYADFGSAAAMGKAPRLTLFPGRSFDEIPRWRRFIAVLRSVAGCRTVCLGVPYSELDFLVLALVLRLRGVRVVLLSVSKFDDFPRSVAFEWLKRLGLCCFSAVVVPGVRGHDYYHFLGFRRRPVVMGGNTISIARVRAAYGGEDLPARIRFAERDFVYVGRFIEKKNLSLLIEAYAQYCRIAGKAARRLVLVGSGPLEARLRREAAEKLDQGEVIFTGFLAGSALYAQMAQALSLVLVSTSEQWGLVVNEALALGLPVISSEAPGACDLLIRNLVNGYVIENQSVEGLARAMQQIGADEAAWLGMSEASRQRAALGDVAIFAEAVAGVAGFAAQAEAAIMADYRRALDEFRGTAVPVANPSGG